MAKRKQLTAMKLFRYLDSLRREGKDLNKITINIREDRNSDTSEAQEVEEDLYDAKTNNVLESIVLIADPREV
jgi:hypothetical protein